MTKILAVAACILWDNGTPSDCDRDENEDENLALRPASKNGGLTLATM
jgi:hypothetical protein